MSAVGRDGVLPITISVVLPTYNRLGRLHAVLESLNDQDISEPFEVIVVSDGSSDGTDEFLAHAEFGYRLVAVTQQNAGPAAARNAGLALATGELIVFIDDDVVAHPSLLATHRATHRRMGPNLVVVGPMLNPSDHDFEPWVAWEQAMLEKQYDALVNGYYPATPRQFYTGNASVAREHVERVGAFDVDLRRAEDVEMAFRLAEIGLEFRFEPTAIGYHYAERSYESWRQIAYAYGRNDVIFARDRHQSWVYDAIREQHSARDAKLRWLVRASSSNAALQRTVRWLLERPITWRSNPRLTRTVRAALSGVYAIEYHSGLLAETGSRAEYRRLFDRSTVHEANRG